MQLLRVICRISCTRYLHCGWLFVTAGQLPQACTRTQRVMPSGTRAIAWSSCFSHLKLPFSGIHILYKYIFSILIDFLFSFFLQNIFSRVTNGSWLTQIHIAGNLLFLQYFHGEVVGCYGWLDSICAICLAQMIWSELHAHRNIWQQLQPFDDWWDKYLVRRLGVCLVSQTCLQNCRVVTREVAHIGLSSDCCFRAPSGSLNSRPTHSMAQLSTPTPSPPSYAINPSASRTFPISLAALQQLANNAGPDNRLPCQLQVCQPWACQITVNVNSEGGEEKRDGWMWMGEEWREQGGTCWVGGDGENVTSGHIYAQTHTHTHGLTYISLFLRCWHPRTAINVPPLLFPIFLSGNSLGHISPTHLSILFLPPSLSWPHCHACSISIPQSQSSHRFD